jgi:hypothetical protein
VALGDQLEQHAAPGLVAADVAEIVEDQRVGAIDRSSSARIRAHQHGLACYTALHETRRKIVLPMCR